MVRSRGIYYLWSDTVNWQVCLPSCQLKVLFKRLSTISCTASTVIVLKDNQGLYQNTDSASQQTIILTPERLTTPKSDAAIVSNPSVQTAATSGTTPSILATVQTNGTHPMPWYLPCLMATDTHTHTCTHTHTHTHTQNLSGVCNRRKETL